MHHRFFKLAALVLLAWLPIAPVQADSAADIQEWNFKVYLDDSEIGYHSFRLIEGQDQRQLESQADFRVKFLFVTAYRYQHENVETWQGECLQQIESHTDANGKLLTVSGSQGPEGFKVETSDTSRQVPGCVKTFAYWDPRFLSESALLNSQTGEVIPVVIEPLPEPSYRVRGQEVPAQGYRMRGKNLDMEIWYSMDRQWLGLVSSIKGGRTLRYELI